MDCQHATRTLTMLIDENTDLEVKSTKDTLGWGVWCKDCQNLIAVAPTRNEPHVVDIQF